MRKELKVLVVDDFEMMRFQLKKELVALGYTDITEAVDGKVAIDLLTSQSGRGAPFDLVFCDWNMPNVSGLEVLKFCRGTAPYQLTPFVMVTAEAEQEAIVKAIKTGASDYIVKPMVGEALQARIKSIIARTIKPQAA